MEVRVTKASSPAYWYAGCSGISYEVVEETPDSYLVYAWTMRDPIPPDVDPISWALADKPAKVAPILKTDCNLVKPKSYPDTRRTATAGRHINTIERSGFNTMQEIKLYEGLNKESPVHVKKFENDTSQRIRKDMKGC